MLKNRVNWLIAFVLLVGTGYFITYYLPLIMPGVFFEYDTSYEQYEIHSDRPINRGVTFVLEEVTTRLKATELHSPDEEFSVYFCYDREKYGRFAEEVGQNPNTQGFTIEPYGHAFINLSEISDVGAQHGEQFPHSLLSGSASHILAHELTHVLLTRRTGVFESADLPEWKREGYAEYAASKQSRSQDTTYSFRQRVDQFLSGAYDEVDPARQVYVKYGLMVEYLLDIREITLADLLSGSQQPDTVFEELKKWANRELEE